MPDTYPYVVGIADASSNFIDKQFINVKSDLIYITRDKAEIILIKEQDAFKYHREWATPFSICLTIGITVLTTTFEDFFIFKGYELEIYFWIIGFLSLLWLIYSIWQWFKYRKSGTVESILNKMMGG